MQTYKISKINNKVLFASNKYTIEQENFEKSKNTFNKHFKLTGSLFGFIYRKVFPKYFQYSMQ